MKTYVKDIARKVDVAIPDVTMDTVKDDSKDILCDVANAAIYSFTANVYLGSAILKAVPLGAKVFKTTAKKAILKAGEVYYDKTQTITIYR